MTNTLVNTYSFMFNGQMNITVGITDPTNSTIVHKTPDEGEDSSWFNYCKVVNKIFVNDSYIYCGELDYDELQQLFPQLSVKGNYRSVTDKTSYFSTFSQVYGTRDFYATSHEHGVILLNGDEKFENIKGERYIPSEDADITVYINEHCAKEVPYAGHIISMHDKSVDDWFIVDTKLFGKFRCVYVYAGDSKILLYTTDGLVVATLYSVSVYLKDDEDKHLNVCYSRSEMYLTTNFRYGFFDNIFSLSVDDVYGLFDAPQNKSRSEYRKPVKEPTHRRWFKKLFN